MTDFLAGPWNALFVHPLMVLTALAYGLTRDFGLAIVMVTIVIRLAVYPLYVTQIRSQRAMQEVAPALEELKRKYGKDRAKFAEEQMKLYKERGVSPLSGCLPLLLQLPILFALYSALLQLGCGLGPPPDNACPGLTSEQLQSVMGVFSFLPNPIPPGERLDTTAHWLPWLSKGLASPDPIFILPILAGATQLIASVQALPAKQVKSDDPNQRMFQSMAYTFPLMTVFLGATFPSGLTLYWITTTLFQIVQQYFVSGWGQLPKYLPFLRNIPTPADRDMKRREAAAITEGRADMAKLDRAEAAAGSTTRSSGGGEGRGEGRRRGRRRGRR